MSGLRRRRVAVIRRPPGHPRPEDDFIDAVLERCSPELVWDHLPQGQSDLEQLAAMDSTIVFWPYRLLVQAPDLGLGALRGRAVMIEHDAFGDYTSWGALQGTWPTTFGRHGFDLLVCSGLASVQHFERLGVPVALVHKGVATERFHDLGGPREGFCTYGTDYTSRVILKRKLRAARLPVEQFAAPYHELNGQLNRYAAMVTTVRGTSVKYGQVGRLVERVRRGTFVQQEPAPEPMMKIFESTAAGCAVFTDAVPDLPLLGFEDGRNIISFDTIDECVERVRHYLQRPDELAAIGEAAAALVGARHSWRSRAADLEAAIFPEGS